MASYDICGVSCNSSVRCVPLLLQLLSDALPSFSADQLSQLMWAYAQFGHQPSPALMAAVLAQTEASVAALQVGLSLQSQLQV